MPPRLSCSARGFRVGSPERSYLPRVSRSQRWQHRASSLPSRCSACCWPSRSSQPIDGVRGRGPGSRGPRLLWPCSHVRSPLRSSPVPAVFSSSGAPRSACGARCWSPRSSPLSGGASGSRRTRAGSIPRWRSDMGRTAHRSARRAFRRSPAMSAISRGRWRCSHSVGFPCAGCTSFSPPPRSASACTASRCSRVAPRLGSRSFSTRSSWRFGRTRPTALFGLSCPGLH